MKKTLLTPHLRSLRLLLALSLLGLLASLSSAQQPGKSPVKIYLLVGQSNMLGYGTIEPGETTNTLRHIVENDPKKEFQSFIEEDGSWTERSDVWIHMDQGFGRVIYSGLKPGYGGSKSNIGPEFAFGQKMGDAHDGQVLIIKTSWGGKSLGNDFLPPSIGKYPKPIKPGNPGFYYHEILRIVKDVTENIKTYFPDYQGQGVELAGLCYHQGWNDQYGGLDEKYEENFIAFINDIRSAKYGLGVPNLPIVIASSGMITKESLIKQAQLLMGDTSKYPQFKGNVAVIDTDKPYGPEKLQFLFDAENSPAKQEFHWNRNARTHLNLGFAMAAEMPKLKMPALPSRLEAYGVAEGIQLTWQKGTEVPKSIKLLRNGKSMKVNLSGSQTVFVDPTALPGKNDYELVIEMPSSPTQKLTASSDTSPTELTAYRSKEGVTLDWKARGKFEGFKISRDGKVLEESFSADAKSYQDKKAPKEGKVHYSIQPTTGKVTPATATVNLGPFDPGEALIYEPFAYLATAALAGNQGATGTTGPWTTSGNGLNVTPLGLSYGSLPVGGNKLDALQGGRKNQISFGSTLADAGLLNDGATLWFSLLVKPLNSSNVVGEVFLGNSLTPASGVGFQVSRTRLNYWVDTKGKGVRNLCSNGGLSLHRTQLIVGKLTWGTGGANDSFILYLPGTDLELAKPQRSATPFNLDQSTFDRFSIIARNALASFDEIRFGATYESVIGGGTQPKAE